VGGGVWGRAGPISVWVSSVLGWVVWTGVGGLCRAHLDLGAVLGPGGGAGTRLHVGVYRVSVRTFWWGWGWGGCGWMIVCCVGWRHLGGLLELDVWWVLALVGWRYYGVVGWVSRLGSVGRGWGCWGRGQAWGTGVGLVIGCWGGGHTSEGATLGRGVGLWGVDGEWVGGGGWGGVGVVGVVADEGRVRGWAWSVCWGGC